MSFPTSNQPTPTSNNQTLPYDATVTGGNLETGPYCRVAHAFEVDHPFMQRAVTFFLWTEGVGCRSIARRFQIAYGTAAISKTTVMHWCHKFAIGQRSVLDRQKPGRPKLSAKDPELIERVAAAMNSDPGGQLSVRRLAKQVGVSMTTAHRLMNVCRKEGVPSKPPDPKKAVRKSQKNANKNAPIEVKCDLCLAQFENSAKLRDHILEVHVGEQHMNAYDRMDEKADDDDDYNPANHADPTNNQQQHHSSCTITSDQSISSNHNNSLQTIIVGGVDDATSSQQQDNLAGCQPINVEQQQQSKYGYNYVANGANGDHANGSGMLRGAKTRERHACDRCSKVYQKKGAFLRHMRQAHKIAYKDYNSTELHDLSTTMWFQNQLVTRPSNPESRLAEQKTNPEMDVQENDDVRSPHNLVAETVDELRSAQLAQLHN